MSSATRKNITTAVAVTKRAVKLPRSSSPINDVDVEARPTKRVKVTSETSETKGTSGIKATIKKKTIVSEESQASLIAHTTALNIAESQSSQPAGATEASKTAKRAPKKKTAATEPVPEDFAPRKSRDWKVGAHISGAGGIENAVVNAAKIGAESFALFLKNQRKWKSPDLSKDSIEKFKARMESFGYDFKHVLPHGSYLINLGNPDAEKRRTSYDCFLDDLVRCEQTGISLYNFHPGSTVGQCTVEESIGHIAESLNKAHKATSSVITVIENMAGAGNVLGCTFEQLARIIAGVEDKKRVGICIDTCHLFSSGYDIRTKETYEATMAEFASKVGFEYLKGLHLNDSKMGLNSKKDRHEHLGQGHIGLRAFGFLMRDNRLKDIPMVLETETEEVWPLEVDILQRMSDPDLKEEDLELNLDKWTAEIKEAVKMYAKEDKKEKEKPAKAAKTAKAKTAKEKAAPKAVKGKAKGKKKKDESEEDASENYSDEDD